MTHSELRPPPALLGLPRFLASRASWPPALLGLPRLLTRAVPTLSLVCLAMTLSSAPAQAGTWKFSCTDASTASGGSAKTYTNSYVFMGTPQSHSDTIKWVPPADATGTSYSLPSFGFDTGGGTADADTKQIADVSVTAKITMTWIPDASLPSDPAPTSLWLIESSSAQWTAQYEGRNTSLMTGSGSADDGIGDAPVATSANGIQSGEVSSSGSATSITTPPAHWFQQPVSGGVVTLTRTFHASDSASLPQDGLSGSMTTGCSFGGYTLSIHAQPYDYHKTGQTDNGDGTISFAYDWLSTTGNKADLTTCTWHEYVTYPGATGPGSYFPPSCFANSSGLDNPTISPSPGTASMASTTCTDTHHTWSVSQFYVYTTVTASQSYEFDDSAPGQTNVLIPGPDSTASIVRTVTNTGTPSPLFINWYYSVSKQGLTAWLQLP